MFANRLLSFALASGLASTAVAQLPGPGFSWAAVQGIGAVSYLQNCTQLQVGAVRGDTVTLRIWGDPNAPYLLFMADTTLLTCAPFPGIGGGQLLNPPVFTIAFGTLTQLSPCLSCPPAFEPLVFTVPATLPTGFSVAFQAASLGANHPSFTDSITATVQ